jgi:SUN domain-containing protein 1/2
MFGGLINLGWFWPLRMSTTSPRNAIQPGVQPGQCWAFKGSAGRLLIALSSPMIPRRFSIEHIPRCLSPNGRIDSAPRNFMVHGLMAEFDKEPVKLGEYEYDAVNGEPLQMFEVNMDEDKTKNFKLIEVEIKSNHGHPEYTCLYRFRVHGN